MTRHTFELVFLANGQVESFGSNRITSSDENEKASQEALHWLIALREEPDDPHLRTRFDAWLARNPGNGRAWDEAQQLWALLGSAESAVPASERQAVGGITGRGQRASRGSLQVHRRGRGMGLRLAAAGLCTLCLVFAFLPAISIWLNADHATATAETRTIHLDDGSTVYLGASSAVDVAFDPAQRKVTLLEGEAYFEVEPDPDRPFKVRAANVETTVLGTAFDVDLTDESVAVAVNHGSVAVSTQAGKSPSDASLGAGDWVRVDREGQVERGKDAPDLAGGWRSGMLVVRDRSISSVIDEIGRHYRGSILIADSTLARQRITGVYDLRNPADAVSAIAQTYGARVRQISPWIMVISQH
ncbi:FecR family protein [Sinorhizobium sp. BG8]|uniref:FecR family protein n=1 Tax=Sinorhizobium sp. BG8 TaxID=2613773 RepID=UPI00193D17A2|nr:FecR family protein [Sinorhizobium sp. BG8]